MSCAFFNLGHKPTSKHSYHASTWYPTCFTSAPPAKPVWRPTDGKTDGCRFFRGEISNQAYIAGPLFNIGETYAQDQLRDAAVEEGFSFFLPQEDGLELARLLPQLIESGLSEEEAREVLNRQIADLDLYQVSRSCVVIANLDGIEPDSGTVAELVFAVAIGLPVILFRTDVRTLIGNTAINPLVQGQPNVTIVGSLDELRQALGSVPQTSKKASCIPIQYKEIIRRGREVAREQMLKPFDDASQTRTDDVARKMVTKLATRARKNRS